MMAMPIDALVLLVVHQVGRILFVLLFLQVPIRF